MKKNIMTFLTLLLILICSNFSFASKVEKYQCGDELIKVTFPNEDYAIIVNDDDVILLKNVEAANGARYVGEGTQLWSYGNDKMNIAVITSEEESEGSIANDKGIECNQIN